MRRAMLAAPLALAACTLADGTATWPIVYQQRCADAACLGDFVTTDASKWRMHAGEHAPALELVGRSDYRPPHRSPHSIALIEHVEVADFDLDVDLLQTGRNYGHRDLCLFFGLQSPARFYYVHLATTPDPNAHNVFVVADAPRRNLSAPPAEGIDWGRDEWHHVHVERRVAAGTIKVWWDDRPEPVLEASDRTFDWGRVGFGSFDDSGLVRNIVLRAPRYRHAEGDPFGR
ncbi:MAG: hypothetical protein KAI24_08565 [Planctomycetes bacterium]|nr:hypothetical protein [Planctomycetota bacterium]